MSRPTQWQPLPPKLAPVPARTGVERVIAIVIPWHTKKPVTEETGSLHPLNSPGELATSSLHRLLLYTPVILIAVVVARAIIVFLRLLTASQLHFVDSPSSPLPPCSCERLRASSSLLSVGAKPPSEHSCPRSRCAPRSAGFREGVRMWNCFPKYCAKNSPRNSRDASCP